MPYESYIPDRVETIDSVGTSYTQFTSSLITSTFEALLDTTLKQVEAYTDMVTTMSKDLTTFINETQDEIHDEQVLEYLELLPLQQAQVLSSPENSIGLQYNSSNERELVEIQPDGQLVPAANGGSIGNPTSIAMNLGKAIIGNTVTGTLANTAISTIKKSVKLPDSIASTFPALGNLTNQTDPQNAATTVDINKTIFDAVAQRIASNKYAMLENMVRLGFARLVVDNGLIETRLTMSFKEVNKYSSKKIDKVKNRERNTNIVREKPSLSSFLFRGRNKSRSKQKHVHFEVHKSKEKESITNTGKVGMSALVRINFSTDYQPLAGQ